jgi:hypothetical protein
MKPSALLAVLFVVILSACASGRTPTAPSQPDQPTPTVQPPKTSTVTLTFSPNPAVANEATTFVATASSSVSATLDFGDGARVTFGAGSPSTLKHIYGRPGTITATFSATNASGDTASVSTVVEVR